MKTIESCVVRVFMMAALLCSGGASAAVVVLQPGAAEGKDTHLADAFSFQNTPFGASDQLLVNWDDNGRSIGLVQFDLSAIASGSTVNSATLSLFHLFNIQSGSTYNIFRVTSVWDELTTFDTRPSIDATAFASLVIDDLLTFVYRDWDITALVQGWVDGSYANFGLWIEEIPVQGDGSMYLASSDGALDQAPRLTIEFDAADVPEPASVMLLAIALLGAGASLGRARSRRS